MNLPNLPDIEGSPCPDCGDGFETRSPLHPWAGICWACLPCYCGDGCGYTSGLMGANGIKSCETEIPQPDLDERLAERLGLADDYRRRHDPSRAR